MRRRDFIAGLGGAAAWPFAARAQQAERVRRIGVLMHLAANDPESQRFVAAFLQGLEAAGWSVGRNLQIEFRWTSSDPDRIRRYAAELIALAPEVILTNGSSHLGPLLEATRTVPIVFVNVTDPVGAGFVASLARPGGNATGFTTSEYGISAKWLELLKAIAPGVTRAAILRNPGNRAGIGQFGVIQGAASSLGVEVSPVGVRDTEEIERGIMTFARGSNGGLIVTPSGLAFVHRELIIALAAQYRLPAVYSSRIFAADGGLIAYAPDSIDPFRRAADYVDRILKGEKPADLPVQQATKVQLVINLRTVKALGLTVPETLLATADEVIQ